MGNVLPQTYFCLASIIALISLNKCLKYLAFFSSVLYVPHFRVFLNFIITIYLINMFLDVDIFDNIFMHRIYSESTALNISGITPHLTSSTRPPISVLYLKFDQHIYLIEI